MGALSSVVRGVDAANSLGEVHSSWQMRGEQRRRRANGESWWDASKHAAASNPYNRIGVKAIIAVLVSVILCYLIVLAILFAYGVKDGIFILAFGISIIACIPIIAIIGLVARWQTTRATLSKLR